MDNPEILVLSAVGNTVDRKFLHLRMIFWVNIMKISRSIITIISGVTILAIAPVNALQNNPANYSTPQTIKIARAIACSPIRGTWFYDGKGIPVSEQRGNRLRINMSNFGRPNASGVIISPTEIQVTFPDDGTFIGTVNGDGKIRWNNNTIWEATQFAGTWQYEGAYGPRIVQLGDELRISMSRYNRPPAQGRITAPGQAIVDFTDDDVHTATLTGPSCIRWSNGTTWTK